MKQYGNEYKIGKFAIAARIRIYKRIVLSTVYHNVEAWSNITKTDMEELESMQKRIVCGMCEMRRSTPYVCGMCEMRRSTPYVGLLAELGIWPVEQLIQYKQVRLLHNIITSKDGRLIKEIIEDQIDNPWEGCWYEGVETTCRTYGVTVEEIREWSKYKCKREMKKRKQERIDSDFQEKKTMMTKLRFIKITERKKEVLGGAGL